MKFTDNFIPTYANTQSVQLKMEYPKYAPACRFFGLLLRPSLVLIIREGWS